MNQDVLMQHYRADGIYTPEKQAIRDLEQTDDGLMLSG